MGTKFKGAKEDSRALDVYIKFTRAYESLGSKVNLLLSKYGLSESQFGILDALFYLGPLTQKEIAKKIFKSGGNVTMVVDNLEKNNYVVRKKNLNDRRVFEISLTDKGKKLFKKIFPKYLKIIKNSIGTLNEFEQLEMQKFCKRIGLRIES